MKKLISLLLLIMLFSGCLTVKQIERNCDKFAQICITEIFKETVYRDTTIYRTDTIRVPLPVRDTVTLIDTVEIIDGNAFMATRYETFGIIEVEAGVQYSVLTVRAYLNDSTILHTFRDTILLEKIIKEQITVSTVPVKYVPFIYKFVFYLFIMGLILLFGYLGWKLKTNKFKL